MRNTDTGAAAGDSGKASAGSAKANMDEAAQQFAEASSKIATAAIQLFGAGATAAANLIERGGKELADHIRKIPAALEKDKAGEAEPSKP